MKRLTTLFNRFFFVTFFIAPYSFCQEYINFYPWTNGGLSATDWRSDPDPQQTGAKTGCIYSDVSVALSGGAWQTSNPQWAYNVGGMATTDGFGMRLGVNWTNVNQTVTFTITFKDGPGGNITEYPVDFSIFDINAHVCGAISANRFIDVVSIVGYKANLTTAVNPNSIVPSCAQNVVTGNSVKGSGSCGNTKTAVTFNSTNTVARIVITYSSGTGDPASQNCAGTPPQLLAGNDPRAQEIFITPFRLTAPSSSAPTGITGTTSICSGGSTTLTATGGNSSSKWYTGSCGGTLVHTGSTFVTPVLSSNTTYYVANQNLCGITTCASATVTVTAPPSISSQPTNASICTTGSATLSVTASSGPYQWQYNNAGTWQNVANATPTGVTYSGQTTNSLSISASNVAAGTYSYRCVVGSSCSSVNTSTAILTVSSINTTGMVANEWVWTGAQSTTYETSGNWLSWNGTSSFTIPAAAPTTSNSVRIKQVSGCIINSPNITTTGANSNDITIETSAQLTSNNATNLTVAGSWSNSGTYIENQGKISFTGSAKTLTCSGGETFYDLSSASTSTLTLNNNATVSNGLWLNGIISTASNRVNLNTSAIDGVSTGVIDGNYSGHINGNFRRTVSTNTATYRFPMGVGTTLTTNRRLLEWVNNNLSGISYLDCSASNSFKGSGQNTDANISSSLAVQNGQVVSYIHPEAQWRLTPNTTPTGGSYGVRLYVQNFATLSASYDNKFVVLKRQDNSTSFANYSTFQSTTTIPAQNAAGRVVNSGNGYAQRLGYTSFSEFVIGSVPTPLGIELKSFDISCVRNDYELKFSTSSETNASHYQVMSSSNGYHYDVLHEIAASGTTNEVTDYTTNLKSGAYSYLKLLQFDFNGEQNDLFTLHVPDCDGDAGVYVVNGLEDIKFILPYNVQSEYVIYSSDAKLIAKGESMGTPNEVIHLDKRILNSGTYFIQIQNSQENKTLRFLNF